MRSKRFSTYTPEQHALYAVTFEEWFQWALKVEFITGVGEQVMGFGQPENSSDTSTPLQRRVQGSCLPSILEDWRRLTADTS